MVLWNWENLNTLLANHWGFAGHWFPHANQDDVGSNICHFTLTPMSSGYHVQKPGKTMVLGSIMSPGKHVQCLAKIEGLTGEKHKPLEKKISTQPEPGWRLAPPVRWTLRGFMAAILPICLDSFKKTCIIIHIRHIDARSYAAICYELWSLETISWTHPEEPAPLRSQSQPLRGRLPSNESLRFRKCAHENLCITSDIALVCSCHLLSAFSATGWRTSGTAPPFCMSRIFDTLHTHEHFNPLAMYTMISSRQFHQCWIVENISVAATGRLPVMAGSLDK